MPKDEKSVQEQQAELRINFGFNTEQLTSDERRIIDELVRQSDGIKHRNPPIRRIKIYGISANRTPLCKEHQFTAQCCDQPTGRMTASVVWLICANDAETVDTSSPGWYLKSQSEAWHDSKRS